MNSDHLIISDFDFEFDIFFVVSLVYSAKGDKIIVA